MKHVKKKPYTLDNINVHKKRLITLLGNSFLPEPALSFNLKKIIKHQLQPSVQLQDTSTLISTSISLIRLCLSRQNDNPTID